MYLESYGMRALAYIEDGDGLLLETLLDHSLLVSLERVLRPLTNINNSFSVDQHSQKDISTD